MLYLVPSPLSQTTPRMSVLHEDLVKVQSCQTWLVESAKPARAALQFFDMPRPIHELQILELKSLDAAQKTELIKRCAAGENMALMSDAGCPGIADPGADFVEMAHQNACVVHPLVGPSSILLALMSSGLNGQNFHFHGYLPVEAPQRDKTILLLEKNSAFSKTTQIVIETPFRNQKLMEALLNKLSPQTRLCVASDLQGGQEQIRMHTIQTWKLKNPALEKVPTLFLWLS